MADTKTPINWTDIIKTGISSIGDIIGSINGNKYNNYPVQTPYNGTYIPPQNNNPIDTSAIMIIAGIVVVFLALKK
ncbi:hypothetical protein [Siphonobacter aquaeclarae]|uniref:Uncharacterized protein n=1 Tax=Siphonobacter aquaeclarae TaxID=563176 RepID=A0A1G9T956_9BACT|nr:hypothetical protein [Siphonobacter aquaeclarae]SDM44299.1 hypothetical protein SAMN04488090_3469 [Siphonobacter aquaeclarae]